MFQFIYLAFYRITIWRYWLKKQKLHVPRRFSGYFYRFDVSLIYLWLSRISQISLNKIDNIWIFSDILRHPLIFYLKTSTVILKNPSSYYNFHLCCLQISNHSFQGIWTIFDKTTHSHNMNIPDYLPFVVIYLSLNLTT